MMKTPLMFSILALAFSAPALAQVPRYDVEGHCTEITGFGGTYSNSLFNSCIDKEQTAYDHLKSRWNSISEKIKDHCDEIATFDGSGSYSLLESCIKMEESAGTRTKTFKY